MAIDQNTDLDKVASVAVEEVPKAPKSRERTQSLQLPQKDYIAELAPPKPNGSLIWALVPLVLAAACGWYVYKGATKPADPGAASRDPASVAGEPAKKNTMPELLPEAPKEAVEKALAMAPKNGLPLEDCAEGNRPVCAFANGAPVSYPSSCAANTAKALMLYHGECTADQNPSVRFKAYRLQDMQWHLTDKTERAAVVGESLDVDLEALRLPPVARLQVALLSADGKIEKVRDMAATSTVFTLGQDLPRGGYDLEVRVLDDKGNRLFVAKAKDPFYLVDPAELKARVITLPGPAERKPSSEKQH